MGVRDVLYNKLPGPKFVRDRLERPRKSFYTLWELPAPKASEEFKDLEVNRHVTVDTDAGSQRYEIRLLTEDDLPLFDEVRPEAPTVPRSYLEDGHVWIGAIAEDGTLAAYTFLVLNEGTDELLAKRYFVLQPGEAYLHAAWTHPAHRRRGLHTFLTEARIKHAAETAGITNIVTHVAVGLLSSEQAFRDMGFDPTHRLTVSRHISRRKVKNSRKPIESAPHEDESGALKVMILDGDVHQSVAAMEEITQNFPAKMIVVSSDHESRGAKAKTAWQSVVLPKPGSDNYTEMLNQAILALKPDVVVPTSRQTAEAAIEIQAMGQTEAAFVGPDSLAQLEGLADLVASDVDLPDSQAVTFHAGYYVEGNPLAELQLEERQGPPRVFSTVKDEGIALAAREVLAELRWTGLATLAYTRDADGSPQLVDTLVGLWPTYALSHLSGANLLTKGVIHALGLKPRSRKELDYAAASVTYPAADAIEIIQRKDFAAVPTLLKTLVTPAVTKLRG